MAKTKDGFYKQIGTTEGSNSYLLLAGGDYIGFSSSSGNNTIVQRDANGFIVNSYFNTTSGGAERNASGLGYIAGFNTSDYYIRSYTSDAVKSWLGLGSNAYTSTAYLPLTGGTMTNSIFLPLNLPALRFGNTRNWDSAIGHDSASYEVEAFMTKNIESKYRFKVGFDPVNFANGTFVGMTNADLEIGAGYCKINNNTVWHAGNDGTGSGLDADLLDGIQFKDLYISASSSTASVAGTVADRKADLITYFNSYDKGFGANTIVSNSVISQWNQDTAALFANSVWDVIKIGGGYAGTAHGQWLLSSYGDNKLGVVGRSGDAWTPLRWIAFETSNVESANKLKTARTIAGVNFDGTDNISIPFNNLSSKPTTLSGYGITDAQTALSNPLYTRGSKTLAEAQSATTTAAATWGSGMWMITHTGYSTHLISFIGSGSAKVAQIWFDHYGNNAEVNYRVSTNDSLSATWYKFLTSRNSSLTINSDSATIKLNNISATISLSNHNHTYITPINVGILPSDVFSTYIAAYAKGVTELGNITNTVGFINPTDVVLNVGHEASRFFRFMSSRGDGKLRFQTTNPTATDWGAVETVAFISSNVASATKLGTATIGSTVKPFYLNAGTPIAFSTTVGSTSKGVYMNAGSITEMSATVGSSTAPVYMNAGTITACGTSLGVSITGNAATASKVIATVTGTNSTELVRGNMADSGYFRILVGGTASDAGYAEIATADGGTEPIYVRQYSGAFTSLIRTATLLDESGNTIFPGAVAGGRFYTGYDSGQANSVSCSNWFRSNGTTGWINASYGGGIYQEDSTYVKVYGSKAFKVTSTASDSINTDGGIEAFKNITTNSGFINTSYPGDAILLAGGGATTFSGLYKHCITFSSGAGSDVVTKGLFTACASAATYYNNATQISLFFSVPSSLPALNKTTVMDGTYKIDVTSYITSANVFEDRAWCISSIGTNEFIIVLKGTQLNSYDGTIISVTKRM